jgi:anti-anti-sigma factor
MLNIATREKAGVTIIDLDGQIDGGPLSAKVHELIKQNLAQGKKQFVLNLAKVKWLNSLGAGILIAAYVSAKRENAVLKVFGVSDRVETVLKTCGLIPEVFEVFADEDGALKSF